MSRRAKAAIAVIIVLSSAAIVMNRLNAAHARWSADFCARANALVGLSRADAERALRKMGLRQKMVVRTEQDWKYAQDHVSPTPEPVEGTYALKYNNTAKLAQACVFVYIGEDSRISEVHIATEYW